MWVIIILAIIIVAGGIYYFMLNAANTNTNENVNAANNNTADQVTQNSNATTNGNTNRGSANVNDSTNANTNAATVLNTNATNANTNSTNAKNTNTTTRVTKEVSVTPSGFFPAQVTISKGSTIVWTNNSANTAYVTPDDHPNHTKYKGVWDDDGTGEIAPGETYSHTFSTTGTFTYHNHEDETQAGIVIVE